MEGFLHLKRKNLEQIYNDLASITPAILMIFSFLEENEEQETRIPLCDNIRSSNVAFETML